MGGYGAGNQGGGVGPTGGARAPVPTRVHLTRFELSFYQPAFIPLFCSSSHFCSGAKYSRMALASPLRWPVRTSIASGQGLLWPISSILLNFAPASSDAKKVQRFSWPVYPDSRQSAR